MFTVFFFFNNIVTKDMKKEMKEKKKKKKRKGHCHLQINQDKKNKIKYIIVLRYVNFVTEALLF